MVCGSIAWTSELLECSDLTSWMSARSGPGRLHYHYPQQQAPMRWHQEEVIEY